MRAWFAGPGAGFRYPLPNSTNYLSSRNPRTGRVKRVERALRSSAGANRQRGAESGQDGGVRTGSSNQNASENGEGDQIGTVQSRSEELALLDANVGDKMSYEHYIANKDNERGPRALPPLEPTDMYPYPGNTAFKSEAVLSEELREEIWRLVVVEGLTVRKVSEKMKVTMERVGAVVRLMEVQRTWEREVRL